jgi:excisionase family DNA binding protein
MTTVTSEDAWLSIAQTAEQLGIHARTLRRYIRNGRIKKVILTPQVVRIRPEDIEAFLEENVRIETGTGSCYVPRHLAVHRKGKKGKAVPASIPLVV